MTGVKLSDGSWTNWINAASPSLTWNSRQLRCRRKAAVKPGRWRKQDRKYTRNAGQYWPCSEWRFRERSSSAWSRICCSALSTCRYRTGEVTKSGHEEKKRSKQTSSAYLRWVGLTEGTREVAEGAAESGVSSLTAILWLNKDLSLSLNLSSWETAAAAIAELLLEKYTSKQEIKGGEQSQSQRHTKSEEKKRKEGLGQERRGDEEGKGEKRRQDNRREAWSHSRSTFLSVAESCNPQRWRE